MKRTQRMVGIITFGILAFCAPAAFCADKTDAAIKPERLLLMAKEAIFDLFAQGPKGWDINFKPAYETKYISSLRLKANQNQSLAVEVKPAPNSAAGEYPINLRVSSGDAKGEANLTVILTGTYALEAGRSSPSKKST